MQETIAFIGGGNMATSLIGGLLAGDHAPHRVLVIEPDADRQQALIERFGVRVSAQAGTELAQASIWVLAVKPQLLPSVARDLASYAATPPPIAISVAAGVRAAALARWLGGAVPVIRCMPNTPALIGAGATALYALPDVSQAQRAGAESLLDGAGLTVWVENEAALDAVTATSGSGPAYFFAFMEAMQQTAESMGLAPDVARDLVCQTALGAARMVAESGDDPGSLRARVASPGGTTERALAVFAEGGLASLTDQAMRAAAAHSAELADEFDNQ